MQNEITEKTKLLDDKGRLTQKGFSRNPILEYNPENVRVHPSNWRNKLRIKEWDYYGITTPDYFFSVCVSNIGYIGLVFAYLIDFASKKIVDNFYVTPFGKGCNMPRTSLTGDVHFDWGHHQMHFVREPGNRHIEVEWPFFHKKMDLKAKLDISQPEDHESIVMATPMDGNHFYYNHKINCLRTSGEFTLGDAHYTLKGDRELACLDWGRGVWPYRTFWIWANASGLLPDGRTIGLNMGNGFGDLSAATENSLFLNGRLHKLDWVDIDYRPMSVMSPWKFKSKDGRVNLTFTPFYHRKSHMNFLVIMTKVNQMFGRYNGTVTDDDGKVIEVKDLIGWAEDHNAKW